MKNSSAAFLHYSYESGEIAKKLAQIVLLTQSYESGEIDKKHKTAIELQYECDIIENIKVDENKIYANAKPTPT